MDQFEEVYLPAYVSSQSLIGTGPDRPCSWGNYFWIGEVRILNMWAENLETARERFLPDNQIKVLRHGNHAIVIDDRIPNEWFYNKLCFTGSGGSISLDVAFVFYSILGDPDNELEQFVDQKSYYAKRGGMTRNTGEYNIITYNQESRDARDRYWESPEFIKKGFYADFNQ